MPDAKRKPGRPRKQIDEKTLADLARIHCTMDEMAAILGVHIDTLRDNYSNIIEKSREEGRASLRRMQYLAAKGGNVAMMIWLGKQLLGQREPRDVQLQAVPNADEISRTALAMFDTMRGET